MVKQISSIDLSIIIVNHNSSEYVKACIRSIREKTSTIRFETVVVDNASFDGCGERLASEYPDIIFVQSQSNLGFGGANNLGARHSKAQVLLFLNPDTELKNRSLNLLFDRFNKLEQPGVVGCRLLNRDGSLQSSCVQAFPTIVNQLVGAELLRRLFPKAKVWGTAALYADEGDSSEVEAISGACMMMKREVYDLVGGFSPEYFMYGEDLDLCYKVQRAGYRNYFIGDAVIVHYGGGSTKQSLNNFFSVMMRESVFRFLIKFHGRLYGNCYRIGMCGSAVIRLVILGLVFPVWCAIGRVKGWRFVFRKWLGILQWGIGLKRFNQNCMHSKKMVA
jgi:hypothetical protein